MPFAHVMRSGSSDHRSLANLDIIEKEGLLRRARDLETELADVLKPLEEHALVSEVRAGVGVLAAVQIDPAALEDATLLPRVVPACRRAGIMTRTLATGAIHVSPPLILDAQGLKELAAGIGAALDELATGA